MSLHRVRGWEQSAVIPTNRTWHQLWTNEVNNRLTWDWSSVTEHAFSTLKVNSQSQDQGSTAGIQSVLGPTRTKWSADPWTGLRIDCGIISAARDFFLVLQAVYIWLHIIKYMNHVIKVNMMHIICATFTGEAQNSLNTHFNINEHNFCNINNSLRIIDELLDDNSA